MPWPKGKPRGSNKKLVDPATQQSATPDKVTPKRPRGAKKVPKAVAAAIIDAVETISGLLGHDPADRAQEREAAIAGLLAACRKSPGLTQLVLGGANVGDYGAIVVGLGGFVARVGLDVAALRAPEDSPVHTLRGQVYFGTQLGYGLVNSQIDLSAIMGAEAAEPVEETAPSEQVAPRRTRGSNRRNRIGEDLADPAADELPQIQDNHLDESGSFALAALSDDQ